jgi:hypothetical protein
MFLNEFNYITIAEVEETIVSPVLLRSYYIFELMSFNFVACIYIVIEYISW